MSNVIKTSRRQYVEGIIARATLADAIEYSQTAEKYLFAASFFTELSPSEKVVNELEDRFDELLAEATA